MAGDSAALRARLGSQIKTLRQERKWSQEDLGARSGISYKFIGEIERGLANPTVTTLAALAAAFGVDVAALFGRSVAEETGRQYPLSSEEFIAVREAKDSLETIVNRLGRHTPPARKTKARGRRAAK
jgi:transcriptional regulator with XRE-family HTH domain